jgi:hypothetical protein
MNKSFKLDLPTRISSGHLFFSASLPNVFIGCARSGVKGPLTCGSS